MTTLNNLQCKVYFLLLFVCLSFQAISQNTPQPGNQVGAGTATLQTRPSSYASSVPVNLVREWDAKQPYTTIVSMFTDDGDINKVGHVTQYTDGIGRPLQQVAWKESPTNLDLVEPLTYDGFGREQYQYLPYTSPSSDGNFKTDPFGEQNTFYGTTYETAANQLTYQNETFYYGHTNFEASPLNRVTSKFDPGNSWAGTEGSSGAKSKNIQYLVNTGSTGDNVEEWGITFSQLTYSNEDQSTNVPVISQVYPAGSLLKNVVTDENGNATVEYIDVNGRVVLKKVQSGTIASDFSGYNGFLCTYYVYDDLGQLRFVITPKLVASMAASGSFTLTSDMINELCFRYEYDARGRLIAKRTPGSGWTYMVYDQIDRLVFSQDPNLRNNNEWDETLYDNLNRTVETGILTYTGVPTGLQTNTTQTSNTITGSTTPTIQANLYVNNRQLTSPPLALYQASQSITFDNGFTSETGANFTATIVNTDAQSFSNTIVTSSNPLPTGCTGCTFIPLTLTYYDSYNTGKNFVNYSGSLDKGTNTYADASPTAKSSLTYAMVTSHKKRVIENASDLTQGGWLETVIYYDDKGRAAQVQQDNYKGGVDIETDLYNFASQVLCTYEIHNNASANISGLGIKTNLNYDAVGRLLNIQKTLSGSIVGSLTSQRTIATYSYDALGQLKEKHTGKNSTGGDLEDDVYNYNIHGQLKGINWNYSSSPTGSNASMLSNKWFAMDLSYDWGYSTKQYNGNIAGQRWMNAGDGTERSFGYSYDPANQLMTADFRQNFSGSWLVTDPSSSNAPLNIDFSVVMGDGTTSSSAYDANGNIRQMQQKGLVLNTSPPIDQLNYNYIKVFNGAESTASGYVETNKLAYVTDVASQPNVNLGDFNKLHSAAGDDYGYDKAGNQLTDLNRRINGAVGYNQSSNTGIVYNYLGLPYQIKEYDASSNLSQTVTYIYDAEGNKLEKRIVSATTGQQTATSYLGSFVYQNNVLLFFGTEEGRARFTNNSTTPLVYDYFIHDHLGNTRVVLTEEQKTDNYVAATLEDATLANEKNYYVDLDNNSSRVNTASIADYPTVSGNSYTQQLLATGGNAAVGAGIILKVMAGDKINVKVDCWYRKNGVLLNPLTNPGLGNIISLLTGGVPAASAGKFASSELTTTALTPDVSSFLTNRNTSNSTSSPKAYLNVVLLDEQLRPVLTNDGNNSYFQQVPDESYFNNTQAANNTYSIVMPLNRAITKSGYIYVYVSNEDQNINVYFDNLQVGHIRGPLLETDDYYPYGLKTAGICSAALPMMTNKYQYQSTNSEFEPATGYNEFDLRHYDPQLGRWITTDPYDQFSSPYTGMGNDPINTIDPDGGDDLPAVTVSTTLVWKSSAAAMLNSLAVSMVPDWIRNKQNQIVHDPTVTKDPKTLVKSDGSTKGEYLGTEGGFSVDENTGDPIYYYPDGHTGPGRVWLPDVIVRTIDHSVGTPGLGESMIPIWGAGKSAINDFQHGRWGWGTFNAVMAISDVFLVKSIFTGIGKGVAKIVAQSAAKSLEREGTSLLVERGTSIFVEDAAKRGLSDLDLVKKAATKAENAIGGTGRFAGTTKHTYAKNLLERYQSLFGSRGFEFNYYFNNNAANGLGNRGFLDIINRGKNIIYDFKFGNATMSSSQFLKYSNNFVGYSIQIIRP